MKRNRGIHQFLSRYLSYGRRTCSLDASVKTSYLITYEYISMLLSVVKYVQLEKSRRKYEYTMHRDLLITELQKSAINMLCFKESK